MAIACIIFSHQSKLLASSFDLPVLSTSHLQVYMLYKRSFFCTLSFNCHQFVSTPGVFLCVFFYIRDVSFVCLYVRHICSCHVVLKVCLLTYVTSHKDYIGNVGRIKRAGITETVIIKQSVNQSINQSNL